MTQTHPHQSPHQRRHVVRSVAAATLLACGLASSALAQENPVILQWFETRWSDIERKLPDFYTSGYGATWLPAPSRCGVDPQGNGDSAGYDPWDRFDLGKPTAQTAYGTEAYFKAMVQEFHQANGLVYIDTILNHNGSRNGSQDLQTKGGYPGFWLGPTPSPFRDKLPTDNWGDFHNGISAGYYQSENPNGPRYDRERGDLVSLIDFSHESNNQFIRQPVTAGNPQNIPAGTLYNRPDANNYRFYTDRDAAGFNLVNPGTARNPGTSNFTFYPFNTTNITQNDPVAENGTGYLMRWTQWMLDVHKVDGFRIDAVKHVPSWFWDTYFDSVMYNRRLTPDGRWVTPFSFGESVEGNQFTYDNYIRKSNNKSNLPSRAGDWFGNRDALDIAGSGQLRDLLNANGLGDWNNVLNAHLDVVDDPNNLLQDGSLGIFHTFSHDNGTAGDGGSAPPMPTLRQQGLFTYAYLLMRTGSVKVYHNGRGISRSGGFWPRAGMEIALGWDPSTNASQPTLTKLVQIHNQYGRGDFYQLNFTDSVNSSKADVLVFDRRSNNQANVLVGVNDRWDSGTDSRSVLTAFPAGTRLMELTGNAADPAVDPTNVIPETLVVGGDQRVLITVPRNVSSAGTHSKGYVVYGPALPSGSVTLVGAASALPADSSSVPIYRRRLTALPVVTGNSFTIDLATTPGDPLDINTDDNAMYRIDQGYRDSNGNGQIDYNHQSGAASGYEDFRTLKQPAYNGSTATNGHYQQTIDASQLSEGIHYLSVISFRKRPAGTSPLFREWRSAFYVDRTGPAINFPNPTTLTTPSYLFKVQAADRTAARVHTMLNVNPNTDPRTLVSVFNQATRNDRFDWSRTTTGMQHGFNQISVVTYEESGNSSVNRFTVFVDLCPADFNDDGTIDFFDYLDFVAAFSSGANTADFNGDTVIDFFDYLDFVAEFSSPC
ncbi:MAG: hypothetical protein KGS45_04585 [Planctomycetes bacterium]|nr:hypothetical protein [Planctomycetota bacterium]